MNMSESMDDTSTLGVSEREFVTHLLHLYRDHPVLWNTKSKEYAVQAKRRDALRYIVRVLKNYRPHYTEELLKKKINALRTNFNREYQRRGERQTLESSHEDTPESTRSTLWYYNDLLFIKGPRKIKKTESPKNSTIVVQSTPSHSQSRKSHKSNGMNESNDQFNYDSRVEQLSPPVHVSSDYFRTAESEIDICTKGWAIKLSRLTPDQRRFAEKIINDTLFEAELGTLTREGVCFLKGPRESTPNTGSVSSSTYSSFLRPEREDRINTPNARRTPLVTAAYSLPSNCRPSNPSDSQHSISENTDEDFIKEENYGHMLL